MLNKQLKQKDDVIIIGGGLAGLTAAVYLARAGRRVRLLEKAAHLGGRAITQTRDGFRFNLGPHALNGAGEGIKILAELGVSYTGGNPSIDKTHLIKDGQLHAIPITPRSLLTTRLLNWREKVALAGIMARWPKLKPETIGNVTWQQWLDEQTSSPALQQLLHTISRITTYANAPKLMSADLFLETFQKSVAEPVIYVDGGWQVLVDGLYRAAVDAGATIETGARVTAVRDTGDRMTVRLADGSATTAAAVLLAVDPHAAARLYPHELLQEQAETAVPVRAATLDVALSRLPRPEAVLGLGVNEPTYLSVHSDVAQLAPGGGALIQVARYLGPEEDGRHAQPSLEALLDLMQPGWWDLLVHQRFLPNMIVANRLTLAGEGGLRSRPDTALTNRVFLAGDWIGSTGWLSVASFTSARTAARRILTQTTPSAKAQQSLTTAKARQPAL